MELNAFSDSNDVRHFQTAEVWKRNTPEQNSLLNFIISGDDYNDNYKFTIFYIFYTPWSV